MSILSRSAPIDPKTGTTDPTLRFPLVRQATRPAYLTPAQLLAQYEALAAKGNEAAAFRAKALRARMEVGQ
jgi:hypothetical protein